MVGTSNLQSRLAHFQKLGVSLVLLALLGGWPSSTILGAANDEVLSVSLPTFHIGPQETIVGVEYTLRSAVVVSVGELRENWDIHILNGEEFKSRLEAQALFLSAGIKNSELSYLDDFISIREVEPEPEAHIFDIRVKLTVTDSRWDKIRYVTFSKDQLILTPRQ